MMRLLALIIALTGWSVLAQNAVAQRIAGALSDNMVSVDSTFAGETLTLFGNIEPEIGATSRNLEGPFDIVVVVQGPAIDRVARQKTNGWGVWLNTDQLIYRALPSYFWVFSSDKLSNVAETDVLEAEGILPDTRPRLSLVQGSGDPNKFGPELVRLMTEQGLYGVDEKGIVFRSQTLYSARVALPANVPNGNFLATTYVFKDGLIVAKKAEGFSVRKTGFERLLGTSAKRTPWLYGLACVVLAVFTGWIGGVAFKR